MTSTLADVATLVRSKNAGPFWLTIDIFCADTEDYERVAASPATDPQAIAAVYSIPASSVRIFKLADLHAIKISFARPVIQGSAADRDMHAGQQYVPLLDIQVPDRLQPEPDIARQPAPDEIPAGIPSDHRGQTLARGQADGPGTAASGQRNAAWRRERGRSCSSGPGRR